MLKRLTGQWPAVISIAVVMTAATVAAAPVNYGLKGGINIGTLNGDDAAGLDARVALSGGLYATVAVSPVLVIQPELLFTQKGAEDDSLSSADQSSLKIQLDYLEVPVLARFRVPLSTPTVRPYVFAGPYAAFVLSAQFDGPLTTDPAALAEKFDIANEKSVDYGLVFGGGVDLAAGQGTVSIEARYELGLSTAFEDVDPAGIRVDRGWPFIQNEIAFADATTGEAYDLKTGVFSIMVGFAFF
jgi:hypothetical protein